MNYLNDVKYLCELSFRIRVLLIRFCLKWIKIKQILPLTGDLTHVKGVHCLNPQPAGLPIGNTLPAPIEKESRSAQATSRWTGTMARTAQWVEEGQGHTYQHQGLPLEGWQPHHLLIWNHIQLVKNWWGERGNGNKSITTHADARTSRCLRRATGHMGIDIRQYHHHLTLLLCFSSVELKPCYTGQYHSPHFKCGETEAQRVTCILEGSKSVSKFGEESGWKKWRFYKVKMKCFDFSFQKGWFF